MNKTSYTVRIFCELCYLYIYYCIYVLHFDAITLFVCACAYLRITCDYVACNVDGLFTSQCSKYVVTT